MPKASPALLVALLLVAGLAAPASVGGVSLLDTQAATVTPEVGVSENTTRVLRLEQIQASGFGEPQVVVLDAATAQEAELDTQYSLAAIDERLSDAPNASARRQILRNYTDAAAADVEALQTAERDARDSYTDGEIDAQEYAQKLAVIHARASSLSRFLGGFGENAPSLYTYASPYGSIQNRIAYLNEELKYLTGPVRAEMVSAIQGEREPVRAFLASGEDGFELSYIRSDGVYVRSAYRADNIDSNTSTAGGIELLVRISPDLYPWATKTSSLSGVPILQHGTIRMTLLHSQGRIISHIDETTKQVYYEIQYKRLDVLPVDYAFNRTENGTRVLVSETYPGGPLQVKLLNGTSENKSGIQGVPVTVNETVTHRTGENGVAWFVSPNGEYNVTTTYKGTKFQINITE